MQAALPPLAARCEVRNSGLRTVAAAGTLGEVDPEPVVYRDEALSTMFTVKDILVELQAIRRLLEDDDGEEEVQEDLEQ